MEKKYQSQDKQNLLRLARLARAFEDKGILNGAKLLRALAFSTEARLTRDVDSQPNEVWVDQEMKALIRELDDQEAPEQILSGLENALTGYRENRTILLEDIPPVFVCRFCGEIIFETAPARCPVCGARELSFREFLPYYYLEPLMPAQALEGLRFAAREVQTLTSGLSESQLSWPPQSGEWAISNLLWHLLVAQQLLAARVEVLLSEDHPSLKSVAAWAAGIEETSTSGQILAEYLRSRQAVVALLEGISAEDWLRTGHHDEFGQVTVLIQASYFARHDQHHLPQLEKLRALVLSQDE